MTEFQGWLLLAMLAAMVAAMNQHDDHVLDARLFAVVSLILALTGFIQLALGL